MRQAPIIDMTPDGRFVRPQVAAGLAPPRLAAVIFRIAAFLLLASVAAVAFWAALFIIPALILLGALSYAVLRLIGPRAGFAGGSR